MSEMRGRNWLAVTMAFTIAMMACVLASFEMAFADALGSAGGYPFVTSSLELQSTDARGYKIEFNANGGTGEMPAQAAKRGKAIKLRTNEFTRAGYEFAGWNTKKNGKGKSYKNKAKVKNLAKAGKTKRLYAQWRKSTVHELKVGKTYKKFDVTGDGKPDKVKVKGVLPKSSYAGPGYYRCLKVYVNGKRRLTTRDCGMPAGIYPQVKLVNLASGVPLLYVHYSTSNAYYAGSWVYKCGKKSMKQIFDTSSITADYAQRHADAWRVYETFESVSGPDLVFRSGSYTTGFEVYTYRYSSGKLARV